tara:strand:- start:645 stop:809 length:165 start_codon:yes stop_codon:yes gene_type:complete
VILGVFVGVIVGVLVGVIRSGISAVCSPARCDEREHTSAESQHESRLFRRSVCE